MQPEYISSEGFSTLHKKIEGLTVQLNELHAQQKISRQQETGDESENSELMRLTAEINSLGVKVHELNVYCTKCTIVDINKLVVGDVTLFGSKVVVLDVDSNVLSTYQILGEKESDPKKGKLSYKSPLGSALIGKSIGDYIEVSTPSGFKEYELHAILKA